MGCVTEIMAVCLSHVACCALLEMYHVFCYLSLCISSQNSFLLGLSKFYNLNSYLLLDIRMDWETYNIDQNDHKLVDVVVAYGDAFPVKDADGNEVMSGALLLSDGNIHTAWERDQTPGSGETSAFLLSVTVSLTPQHNKHKL